MWVALMPLVLYGDPSLAVSVLVAVTDSLRTSREWAVSRESLTAQSAKICQGGHQASRETLSPRQVPSSHDP